MSASVIDKFRDEVEKRLGYKLGAPRPFEFKSLGDPLGWRQGPDKKWHLGLWVENGRIKDVPGMKLRTALRDIAKLGGLDFSLTGNQGLVIANVSAKAKPKVDAILQECGIKIEASSGLRRNSMACVALTDVCPCPCRKRALPAGTDHVA